MMICGKPMKAVVFAMLIGTLSKDDGNGDDNATKQSV